jgi:transposase-like protein
VGHLAAIQASQQSGQHRGLALNIDLADPIFHDEARAVAFVEATRWPEGVTCPHCASDRVRRMGGKTQAGMFLCTVMERSHVPLRKWLLAAHLLAASGKGLSAREMERTLGVTYKTAWFLRHRIREAMADAARQGPFGSRAGAIGSGSAGRRFPLDEHAAELLYRWPGAPSGS